MANDRHAMQRNKVHHVYTVGRIAKDFGVDEDQRLECRCALSSVADSLVMSDRAM